MQKKGGEWCTTWQEKWGEGGRRGGVGCGVGGGGGGGAYSIVERGKHFLPAEFHRRGNHYRKTPCWGDHAPKKPFFQSS